MASSSSAMDTRVYDVFLSFRGEDTRHNFVSHLHEAFSREKKFKVFIDNELRKGEEITPTLFKIIEAAKISVIVFSEDYASSTFCLDELVKIIECRQAKQQIVLPIFYKVDPSEIRKLKQKYGEAFSKHEFRFGEMEKVERWKSALREAANLSGWHIDDKSDEAKFVEEIIGQIFGLLTWKLTRQFKGEKMMCKPLDGLITLIAQLEKIWECLKIDSISRVGVYGMGGIGKTTIVTHIYNRFRDENSFQYVYWVTVSKESSVYKLQADIAKEIGLDLSEVEDERRRAEKLFRALSDKKNFVLILDDIWESFDLEDMGIPFPVDGGKLLLTTRAYKVCKGIKCQKIVRIEPLSEEEALNLFIRESGHKIDDNSEFRSVVASVSKECGGLPLAIVTLAKSTRAFVDIFEWRNVLRELQAPGKNHEIEKVFKVLKISYDRLRIDEYQQCLVYCALFPEDWSIERHYLIHYWICEGLIDELDSRQAELDKGNSIINELIDASLLECYFRKSGSPDGKVRMHDMMRDMALNIAGENFLVKAGLQLKDFPKFNVNIERISIMNNPKLEKCSFKLAPKCSKLKTLFMQHDVFLMELPSCFFDNMLNLTVLDISLYSLRSLPDSISKLKNLKLLKLAWCKSLQHIPSLGGLVNLWHLDFSNTKLKELPEGLEKLVNLKVLNISHTIMLHGVLPSEILRKLLLLQHLYLGGSNIEVEIDALTSLENLEILEAEFKSFEALKSYLESKHWQRLESYYISNITRYYNDNELFPQKILWCKVEDCGSATSKGGSNDIVIPYNVEDLNLINWENPSSGALMKGDFAHLKILELEKCKFNCLVDVAFAQNLLQNLEYLEVVECECVQEIIGTEEEALNQEKNYPTIQLPKLLDLHLLDLPSLRSIYRGKMELPSLQRIVITECNKLERLPFYKLSFPMTGTNIGSRSWWDSLKWDNQNHKQAFEKFFPELEN